MPDPVLVIKVLDVESGEEHVVEVPEGDYFIVATEPCHVAHIQSFANGTVNLTIKGRTQP